MKRLFAFAGLILGLSFAANAQAQSTPNPAAIALAERYVVAAEAGKILEEEGPTVAQYMISRMPPPAGGDSKAHEVKQAMLDAADAAVRAKLPEFLDKTAVIYARIFTEKELQDIVAFYDSPSGKTFIAKSQNAAEPVAALIQSLGADIQSDTEQRFCLKESDLCKTATPKAP